MHSYTMLTQQQLTTRWAYWRRFQSNHRAHAHISVKSDRAQSRPSQMPAIVRIAL